MDLQNYPKGLKAVNCLDSPREIHKMECLAKDMQKGSIQTSASNHAVLKKQES